MSNLCEAEIKPRVSCMGGMYSTHWAAPQGCGVFIGEYETPPGLCYLPSYLRSYMIRFWLPWFRALHYPPFQYLKPYFTFLFSLSFLKDLLIYLFCICEYPVAVFRHTIRGHQISLRMVVATMWLLELELRTLIQLALFWLTFPYSGIYYRPVPLCFLSVYFLKVTYMC